MTEPRLSFVVESGSHEPTRDICLLQYEGKEVRLELPARGPEYDREPLLKLRQRELLAIAAALREAAQAMASYPQE